MFKNYFTTAWRHLKNHKLNNALNIVGLALGLTCSLLIIFHVKEELSYDRQFPKADRLYRATIALGDSREYAATSPMLGSMIQQAIPEIEKVARLHYTYSRVLSYQPAAGDVKKFEEKNGYYADPEMIQVFDLPFAKGNPATALHAIHSIVLTESMARKYFGEEDPLGKTITFFDTWDQMPLQVTGILKDLPFNTHLKFDFLVSMSTRYLFEKDDLVNKGWSGFYTYLLLKDQQSIAAVEKKLPDFTAQYFAEPGVSREQILAASRYRLQPVTDIHLHSNLEKEMGPNGDITYVYIFSTAALLILLIGSINFINIATAQAFNRMKEVGVRKAIGATRQKLVGQFLSESILSTLLAALVAMFFFRFALPLYQGLTGTRFQFSQVFEWENLLLIAGIIIVVSLLSGLYPAWFVSNFNVVNALKGKKSPDSSVNIVRKGLIIFQFAVSVFLVAGTLIMYQQMELFQNKKLGFDKEQVIAVKLYGNLKSKTNDNADVIKQELLAHPAIQNVSMVSRVPGERLGLYPFIPDGKSAKDELPNVRFMTADNNFLSTLHIELKEGHNFQPGSPDSIPAFLVNEATVRAFQLSDPVGKNVEMEGQRGRITGVIKDFNFASLHSVVEPMVIRYRQSNGGYLLVKVKGSQLPEVLNFLQTKIAALSPESLFMYSFVDETLDRLYHAEQRVGNIFKAFAVFAILISCLGLFGLSVFTAKLKVKEIGIRKVLGAPGANIFFLLSKDFIQLVLIAVAIATPAAWWSMHKWLGDFAYRVQIGWWVFALAGIIALTIALITVSFQAIKAALSNPVTALRSE